MIESESPAVRVAVVRPSTRCQHLGVTDPVLIAYAQSPQFFLAPVCPDCRETLYAYENRDGDIAIGDEPVGAGY